VVKARTARATSRILLSFMRERSFFGSELVSWPDIFFRNINNGAEDAPYKNYFFYSLLTMLPPTIVITARPFKVQP